MNVLLIGSGGREHALAWKLVQSPLVERLFVAPGNGGTARLEKCENVAIAADALPQLRDFAVAQAIDLTVVGPEVPLAAGVTDLLEAAGLRVFGPSGAAAQLEGSKEFSKEFMVRHQIPTAHAQSFTEFDEAMRYLRTQDEEPVVIKASGLAAGKGVLLPETREEAALIVRQMLLEKRFGAAGETVLIEERLRGRELSVLAFCDGETFHIMPPAQDHKRLLDGDRGPNTGGMGAFTPSPLTTPELLEQVGRQVFRPTLDGLKAEGMRYVGVLYAGLMLTDDGPKVLEFNCRFGDPETQVVLPLLESDLVEIMLACMEGRLAEIEPEWSAMAAVTIVMAAPGYPREYPVGVDIYGVERAEAIKCLVFHAGTKVSAGTKYNQNRLLTDGGRVLNVTALGNSVRAATLRAYDGVARIQFNEAFYRKDIGNR